MSEAAFVRRNRKRATSDAGSGSGYLTVIGLVLAAGLVFYILSATVLLPWMRINRIHVHADFEIERSVLLELAGLHETAYFFNVRPGEIAQRIEEHPLVRTAQVERVFPNALRLDLLRRRPVALVVLDRNGRVTPAAVDEEGVIYDAGLHLAELDLPVISGVEFQGAPVGARMPEMLHGFLESLHRLKVEEPRLFDRVSELQIVPRRNGGFDTLLFTADYRVPVRLGPEITPEICRWALMVLDVLTQQGISGDVAEVDFRSGEIVYRMKEDSHGR